MTTLPPMKPLEVVTPATGARCGSKGKKKKEEESLHNQLLNVVSEYMEMTYNSKAAAIHTPYQMTPEEEEQHEAQYGGPYDTLTGELYDINEKVNRRDHPASGRASAIVMEMLSEPSRELMNEVLQNTDALNS